MRKVIVILAMALVLGGAFAMAAQAANPVLDFEVILSTGLATDVGVIDYTAGGSLAGHDIQVDSVVGLNTPLNANVALPISGGLAFFSTGPFIGATPNELNFATSPAVMNIFGGIPAIGVAAGTNLVNSGTFTEAHVLIGAVGGTALINFLDIKNPDLLAFYGLGNLVQVGGTVNIQFATGDPIDPTGATGFSSDSVLSGDITNTFVPVPPAVWLFGSGLVGLLGLRFRRNRS